MSLRRGRVRPHLGDSGDTGDFQAIVDRIESGLPNGLEISLVAQCLGVAFHLAISQCADLGDAVQRRVDVASIIAILVHGNQN